MTPSDFLVLTALLVVLLMAMALLASGVGLVARAISRSGSAPAESDEGRQEPWQVERLVYRHHRVAGTLITLGSAYFLWQAFQVPVPADRVTSPWGLLWWILAGAHACTFLIGLVVLIKPSRLKSIESLANRRFELDFTPAPVTTTHRPALHGLLIAGIALVVLVGMTLLLIERLGWMA